MMVEEDFEVEHADLVYSGRDRKRPPGASDLVQRIYTLLHEHPGGMTLDEFHRALRSGWLETDAYRAYDHYLVTQRAPYQQGTTADRVALLAKGSGQYGTDNFKWRAQRWWIRERLSGMVQDRTARREGPHGKSRWFLGDRAPLVAVQRKRGGREPLDVAKQRAAYQADTQAHIRREQVKARLREDLLAKRPSQKRLLETINLTYEYLSGR
jgi:hypothetical protein